MHIICTDTLSTPTHPHTHTHTFCNCCYCEFRFLNTNSVSVHTMLCAITFLGPRVTAMNLRSHPSPETLSVRPRTIFKILKWRCTHNSDSYTYKQTPFVHKTRMTIYLCVHMHIHTYTHATTHKSPSPHTGSPLHLHRHALYPTLHQ